MTRLAACVVGLLAASGAQSAPFADPTRPPRESEPPADASGAITGPRLESVLIAPDRRIAVINGRQYVQGARFGDGVVGRITETAVVIRHGTRDEVVKLLPQGAERVPAASGSGREK